MNKKGLTLVEIIVSIGLISIVMVFLFQIIMTIKKANDRQNEKTDVLIAISIITREVEKDLNSFGLDETNDNNPTTECKFDNKDNNNIVPNSATNMQCIKIIYDSKNVKNNEGYILYYTNNDKHFLAYKRGKGNVVETQTVREISVAPLKNFDLSNAISNKKSDNGYSLNIKIPIKNNYNIDANLVINYAKSINNKVTIINKDGLAKQIKGNGIYKVGENVNVSFTYNDYLYEIDDIICNRGVCNKSDSFSFPMPNTDITIYINIKEKPIFIRDYLNDIIGSNRIENNPLASDIGLIEDTTVDTNIRFKGSNPNNYINFNNELWRIVGIFNVQNSESTIMEKLVKIVREDSLGQYSWDSSVNKVNNGKGENDWSNSDLMQELNNDYLSLNHNSDDTTTWYNGENNAKNAVYNYNNNIKKEYQSLIESVVWNIGGWNSNNILLTNFNSKTGIDEGMYGKERVTKGDSTKTTARPTTWTGKIGLIYPTDYAFASEDAACKRLNNKECANLNWLFKSSNYWTITHNKSNATNVWFVPSSNKSAFDSKVASSAYDVYPSLYLKSDTKILRRKGTKENPHLIYLENNE